MQRLFGGDATQMAAINAFSASCDVTGSGGDDCTDSFFQEGVTHICS